MKTPTALLVLLLAAACSPPAQQTNTPAQSAAAPQAAPAAPATPAAPAIDPAAVQALQRMGTYLHGLQNFEVRTKTERDMVLTDTGQKVQFGGDGLYRVRRPNAFYLESNTDRRQRRFYYDGATFTIFSPRMGVFAQRPAPAQISDMVDEMRDRYNIPVPLADLFYWGTESVPNLQLASIIGFARVDGQVTDQYAFREGDYDWQVWIARGDRPLPVRVVITTRMDPAQPQYEVELTWNTNPHFSAATFAFRPPSGVHEIQIAEAPEAPDAPDTPQAQ